MNFWKRFFGHLKTVRSHRKTVRKLCFSCGLYWQGITHDLSKYSPVEFWNGVKYFTGKASPHVGERKALGYSKAWIHHHNKNKHHLPYWMDIDPITNIESPVPMPKKYFIEMICDRVAASMTYLKDNFTPRAPYEYYITHKHENIMHQETAKELEKVLLNIVDVGVKEGLKNATRTYRRSC